MRTILACLLLLLSSAAMADHAWELTFVQQLTQQPQESEQAFVVRTAIYLRDYSRKTGFEACGTLCQAPNGRKSVLLFTGQSQITCPITAACAGSNDRLLPLTIHSHPPQARVVLNPIDAQQVNAKRWLFKKKPGKAMRFKPSLFSKEDYALGPGYMVDGNHVWHQAGRGTARLAFMLEDAGLNQ